MFLITSVPYKRAFSRIVHTLDTHSWFRQCGKCNCLKNKLSDCYWAEKNLAFKNDLEKSKELKNTVIVMLYAPKNSLGECLYVCIISEQLQYIN